MFCQCGLVATSSLRHEVAACALARTQQAVEESRVHRLEDELIAAGEQGLLARLGVPVASQRDDAHRFQPRFAAQASCDLESVHSRQPKIEEHELRAESLSVLQGPGAVVREAHLVPRDP